MKSRIVLYVILLAFIHGCKSDGPAYTVPASLWDESSGNHRAVLTVKDAAEVVTADILWRRHDREPEKKRLIIISASTGDTIRNIHRYEVTNERCKIAFGPAVKGTYYIYYLPYKVQEGWGFYGGDYLKPENAPSEEWMAAGNVADGKTYETFPRAGLKEFQSRTAFDSFYPMEIIALKSEKDELLSKNSGDYLLFPEERTYPIRMKDEIPLRWVKKGPAQKFTGEAMRNEYFAFQVGVYAVKKDLTNLKVTFSSLKNGESEITSGALTCFNTGGTDPYGNHFDKQVDVKQGDVQALWIGIDIPEKTSAGKYTGTVTITPGNAEPQKIDIELKILSDVLADRGDSEPWKHSRLRWLNSTLGIDDEVTAPYTAIESDNQYTMKVAGKEVLTDQEVMPAAVMVNGTNLLARPIAFIVDSEKGAVKFSPPEEFAGLKDAPGIKSASWMRLSDNIEISVTGSIESDGYLNYIYKLRALNDINLKDVRLELPLSTGVAKYMMGMGLPGTIVPSRHQAEWKGPYDSFWAGSTKAGIWCELRGGTYHGPLLNLYKPAYPESWYNGGKGGFRVEKTSKETKFVVYSGARELKKGGEIAFEWSFLLTPVKPVNYKSQFTDRYFHNAMAPMPTPEDIESGIKIVNLHHANNYNPHINYPFIAVDSLRWFVNKVHEKGMKVKIYYTIRELTNYTTEIWALRSLGNEILGDGKGRGYPWLREHLIDGYLPQWYQHFNDKSADASIVNAPGASRWYNYYIEGLAWLVKNVGIDGLYLDDVTYDRRTVKRIRKVLDRTKPGCLLDLHSNTGFSKGPANQYTEYFPYMDKLWFGESFMYSKLPPENWLVEVSGIPFGLMGDMLHAGGNRWLGMLFGMTVRHPWLTEGVTCDPRPVWKVWDEFRIQDAQMVGFWEDSPPVTADDKDVKVTSYIKEGSVLLSIGNFSDVAKNVRLNIDYEKLGLSHDIQFFSPEIKDFQPEKRWDADGRIPVEARKGWIILLKNK